MNKLSTAALCAGAGVGAAGISYAATGELVSTVPVGQGQAENCAAQLDSRGQEVKAADIPEACERFIGSFAFKETVVRVVEPQSYGEEDKVSERLAGKTYSLPSSDDFRSEHVMAAASHQADMERNDKHFRNYTALFVGFLGAIVTKALISARAGNRHSRPPSNAKNIAGQAN